MTRAQTYATEVVSCVNAGKSLAEAVLIVLGGISDGSGPRVSEVADEALKIIAKTA